VASFVRESTHHGRYRGLSIVYIDHHNPDLVLLDAAGEELQSIDLTRLQTTSNIHKLLAMLGMPETCHDENPSCSVWKNKGECASNPSFMLQSCRLSCGVCDEKDSSKPSEQCTNNAADHDCEYWSTMGECTANEGFMKTACARSCGICTVDDFRAGEEDDFDDKDEL